LNLNFLDLCSNGRCGLPEISNLSVGLSLSSNHNLHIFSCSSTRCRVIHPIQASYLKLWRNKFSSKVRSLTINSYHYQLFTVYSKLLWVIPRSEQVTMTPPNAKFTIETSLLLPKMERKLQFYCCTCQLAAFSTVRK
jgi:hypothetical protein